MPAKDFGPIESDYAYFMAHATEAEADASLFARELAPLAHRSEPIRLLDFGCGTGEFTERLLTKLAWPPDTLDLTLLEPVTSQVIAAADRLSRFTTCPIHSAPRTADLATGGFDVVLVNHVLYYVDDLRPALGELVRLVAPTGKLLVAMAPWENALMQFWQVGFSLLAEPVPYYAADDLEQCLAQLGVTFRKHRSPYDIHFADTRDNRLRILRFLFAEHLTRIPHDALLAAFDPYTEGGNIEVSTYSEHFVITH